MQAVVEYEPGAFCISVWVPDGLIYRVQDRITEATKAAKRVGAMLPQLEVTSNTKVIKATRYPGTRFKPGVDAKRIDENPGAYRIVLRELRITACIPKLPGDWELLGLVDQRLETPIILLRPRVELPKEQEDRIRRVGNICDHCGTVRRRKDTLLIQSAAGEYKLVGKACVSDYLGSLSFSAPALLNLQTILDQLQEPPEFDYGDEGEGFRSGVLGVLFDDTVKYGIYIFRKGIVDKERRGVAFAALMWSDREDDERARAEIQRDASITEEAEAALAWMMEQKEASSTYLRNLYSLAEANAVTCKTIGLAESAYTAYARERGIQAAAKEAEAFGGPPRHIGQPGERVELEVRLVSHPRAFENQFGTSYMHKFIVKGGGELVWFASRNPKIEPGTTITIKATVKGHDYFRDEPTTKITRVTVQ